MNLGKFRASTNYQAPNVAVAVVNNPVLIATAVQSVNKQSETITSAPVAPYPQPTAPAVVAVPSTEQVHKIALNDRWNLLFSFEPFYGIFDFVSPQPFRLYRFIQKLSAAIDNIDKKIQAIYTILGCFANIDSVEAREAQLTAMFPTNSNIQTLYQLPEDQLRAQLGKLQDAKIALVKKAAENGTE